MEILSRIPTDLHPIVRQYLGPHKTVDIFQKMLVCYKSAIWDEEMDHFTFSWFYLTFKNTKYATKRMLTDERYFFNCVFLVYLLRRTNLKMEEIDKIIKKYV